jgi:hypothetical protein
VSIRHAEDETTPSGAAFLLGRMSERMRRVYANRIARLLSSCTIHHSRERTYSERTGEKLANSARMKCAMRAVHENRRLSSARTRRCTSQPEHGISLSVHAKEDFLIARQENTTRTPTGLLLAGLLSCKQLQQHCRFKRPKALLTLARRQTATRAEVPAYALRFPICENI